MSIQRFLNFLPGQKDYAALHALVTFYTNDQFRFKIQLSLRAADVPATYLGKSKLGWTSWMRKSPAKHKKQIIISEQNFKFVRTA
jgi:predicted component of type VI protein secretion system